MYWKEEFLICSQSLQEKVNSLLEIIERRPNTNCFGPKSNFESLKGLWRKLLDPVFQSNEDLASLRENQRLEYEENCAIALSLLTNQCVSEVYTEYNGLQSINDKTSSFVFLRMINKVQNLVKCCWQMIIRLCRSVIYAIMLVKYMARLVD